MTSTGFRWWTRLLIPAERAAVSLLVLIFCKLSFARFHEIILQKTTPASVLHVLTHSRVLSHLVNGCTVERGQMEYATIRFEDNVQRTCRKSVHVFARSVFFQRSISELGIGTFGGSNIITATTQTSLVEVSNSCSSSSHFVVLRSQPVAKRAGDDATGCAWQKCVWHPNT